MNTDKKQNAADEGRGIPIPPLPLHLALWAVMAAPCRPWLQRPGFGWQENLYYSGGPLENVL